MAFSSSLKDVSDRSALVELYDCDESTHGIIV